MKTIVLFLMLFAFLHCNTQLLSQTNNLLVSYQNPLWENGNKPFAISNDAVNKDTVQSLTKACINSLHIRPLIIPATLMAYGLTTLNNNSLRQLDRSTQNTITKSNPGFTTTIDNYSQYFPAFAVYGLNAIGIRGKNNFIDRSILYGMTTLLSGAAVVAIKHIALVTRPDGSAPNSFPSGHTTTAFVAAEFLNQEFKGKSVWYSIAGYTIATSTGILRLYNNRHYLSDVVFAAGIGMLSTKLVYMVYPAIKKKFSKHTTTVAVL